MASDSKSTLMNSAIAIVELKTWTPDVAAIETGTNQLPWPVETLKSCFSNGYQNFGLYRDNDQQLLGFIIVHQPMPDEWTIMNVVVSSAFQRQGLGEALVRHVCELAQNKHASVFLEVRESNQPAIALYTKLGFKTLGRRKGYYPTASGEREDAIVMQN
ncbi:ribosomal protein S18-alanine N-acetyltransferase [Pseudidiomarina marina]|uniref:ribosomal protein S18-alanine N-acetyltransferase n=1 Tax=Pseudidiomarina marina TaxID=502366 RepID=UPI0038504004